MRSTDPRRDLSAPSRRIATLGLLAAGLGWRNAAASEAPAHAAPGPSPPPGRVLQVGPGRALATPSQAARVARDGDTVVVDAGDYRGDAAVWTQAQLTLRSQGGRARLHADGAAAQGKALWVMRGGRFDVQGFDFSGVRVPSRNGAGIRFESGDLTVRDCRFIGNEMGLLTANQADAVLTAQDCEFAHNLRPDGHNHNLYVGAIAQLTVTGCWLHHATTGHLLKSRAAVNHILYNRLTDEAGGRASYELEFPNGGVAVVLGNLIQQSLTTENAAMLAYGMEGYRWARNALLLVNNTLVDDLPQGGSFLRIAPGAVLVRALNNLLVGGSSTLTAIEGAEISANRALPRSAFVDADGFDFRPVPATRWPVAPVAVNLPELLPAGPARQYQHPAGTLARLHGLERLGAFDPAP